MVGLTTLESWRAIPGLRHGFTCRAGGLSQVYADGQSGELNLGFTAEDDGWRVTANRAAALRAVGGPAWAGREIAVVRQIHSAEIVLVRASETTIAQDGKPLCAADGMITQSPDVMLGVQAADCVPVLVVDAKRRTAGAFHAGWRGTAAGIVERGIRAMAEAFGSRPEDLLVAIGPAIGPCCYAVGEELRAVFAHDLFSLHSGQPHLDLWEANRRQAVSAGIDPARISVLAECTACSMVDGARNYFSHRADAGRTGRAMGLVGWAAES